MVGSLHWLAVLGLSAALASCAGARKPTAAEEADAASPQVQQCAYGPFAEDKYFPAPAFAGQTRAPAPDKPSPALNIAVFATGLEHPWSLAFLPDGSMLVTERPGRMRLLSKDGTLSQPIKGLPPIATVFAEGLHDVALDPNFASNRLVYFTYYAPPPGKPGGPIPPAEYGAWSNLPPAEREAKRPGYETAARARLSEDSTRLENVEVLFTGANRRLVFDGSGALFIGAATVAWDTPQLLESPYGKSIRILPDGSVPADNPWADEAAPTNRIYARGFKDPEGAALHPTTGELWMTDHGPRGGDEINIIRAGKNYGFPQISYGREYSGAPLIGKGKTTETGMEQPRYYWNPSPALSGLMFYTGDLIPEWKGDLFVGAMASRRLVRLTIDGEKITGEEALLVERCKRIRDVRQGPDGAVYVLTDEDEGEILRLTRSIEGVTPR